MTQSLFSCKGVNTLLKKILYIFWSKKGWGLAGFCVVVILWHWAGSSSFRVDSIKPGRDFPIRMIKADSTEDLLRLREIVQGRFTFLYEGSDSYVFQSEDGQHVIKFFKIRRFTPKYWLNYIPIPWLDAKRLNKIAARQKLRSETFGSLQLAFEKFRYQTGLVFLHLFKTEYLHMKIKVVDDGGKEHTVLLDKVPFVVQKKAVMLSDHISFLLQEGKSMEAVQALYRVLSLIKEGCRRGLGECSAEVGSAYGFIGDRPVYVSIDRLVQDPSFSSSRSMLKEVFRISRALELWIEGFCPPLLSFFQEESQDLSLLLE